MSIFIPLIIIALLFSQSFGAGGARCGVAQFMEDSKKQGKTLAKPGFESCNADNYYNRNAVLEARTKNFIIYYTLDKASPHATTSEYIDSLAKYLEEAYYFHKEVLGMKGILGKNQTRHYIKNVPLGLYPVEVIDNGLLRGDEGKYDNTYGLIPPPYSAQSTQIIIENDFLYGADCKGNFSTVPYISPINGNYSMPGKWHLALKVTVFHELYHSFQIYQVKSLTNNNIFWAEASATGVEEVAVPEVNDYIGYISPSFVETIVDSEAGYGWAMLYLFLSYEFGLGFDSFIWRSFSERPREKFSEHLSRYAYSLGKNAEDLFHRYASYLLYSGKKAEFLPDSLPPTPLLSDLSRWPERKIRQIPIGVLPEASFYFLERTSENWPKTDSATRISPAEYGDASVWVLSRLLKKEWFPPPELKEFAAYPNPWDPKRNSEIKFSPLPEKSTGIEIRSANGVLLGRIKGKPGDELIWKQDSKKLPTPGILYYRTLPHGKNKVLIVEY
ncbi:MAG: hypothetical protein FWB90_05075 [Fibromonadales bacterium]|nr:hypothetical protein [Fibromonadales bacterium]